MTDKELLNDLMEAGEDYLYRLFVMTVPVNGPAAIEHKAKRDFARARLIDAAEAVNEASKQREP